MCVCVPSFVLLLFWFLVFGFSFVFGFLELFDDLDDVFVLQEVLSADPLRVVLHTAAPNQSTKTKKKEEKRKEKKRKNTNIQV